MFCDVRDSVTHTCNAQSLTDGKILENNSIVCICCCLYLRIIVLQRIPFDRTALWLNAIECCIQFEVAWSHTSVSCIIERILCKIGHQTDRQTHERMCIMQFIICTVHSMQTMDRERLNMDIRHDYYSIHLPCTHVCVALFCSHCTSGFCWSNTNSFFGVLHSIDEVQVV